MKIQRKFIRGAFEHILKELEIQNILTSLEKCNFTTLQRAHDSIHEFIYLSQFCFPWEKKEKYHWHTHSAFILYQNEAFYSVHRAFLEALCGYYNVAYTLLRNTLELLLKGAFWECLAHKEYRKRAEIVRECKVKIGEKKRTLLDWLEDIFKLRPFIEKDFEKKSAAIYDKTVPLFKNRGLEKLIPPLKIIVTQLNEWNTFNPIPHPVEEIYDRIYHQLSADVHVIPDETDIGKRLVKGEELFETIVIPEELNTISNLLHKIMDMGIVIELNIFKNWIEPNKKVKEELRKRLPVLEKDLGLLYTSLKIKNL